jgi:hypothetical protein
LLLPKFFFFFFFFSFFFCVPGLGGGGGGVVTGLPCSREVKTGTWPSRLGDSFAGDA